MRDHSTTSSARSYNQTLYINIHVIPFLYPSSSSSLSINPLMLLNLITHHIPSSSWKPINSPSSSNALLLSTSFCPTTSASLIVARTSMRLPDARRCKHYTHRAAALRGRRTNVGTGAQRRGMALCSVVRVPENPEPSNRWIPQRNKTAR